MTRKKGKELRGAKGGLLVTIPYYLIVQGNQPDDQIGARKSGQAMVQYRMVKVRYGALS